MAKQLVTTEIEHVETPKMTAATLLGQCWPRGLAAKTAGVHYFTVAKWLTDPEFQQMVADANRAWLHELSAQKNRIIELAMAEEERNLRDGGPLRAEKRAQYAHEIVTRVVMEPK